MPRILSKIVINEISAVDRPAQQHARAVIMKRADDDDADVITIAKRVVDSGGRDHGGVTSDVYHRELEKLALANRLDGETMQKAYVRLAETTETGSLLFKAALWGPPPKQAPQDFPLPKPKLTGAALELQELAESMAADKKISVERAKGRLLSDPDRKDLLRRLMRQERETTNRVSAQRNPIWAEQEELEIPARLGHSPGSARM
jgi:hypothetical protein